MAGNVTDHMANERTYLAWIRTSLGIMAFGFVVEKFSFFIKQFSVFLGENPATVAQNTSPLFGYSSIFGILLVAFGAALSLLSYIQYRKVTRQIEQGSYQQTMLLASVLMMAVFLTGIFLVAYLISTPHFS
jgi:putative membrane protein